MNITFTPEEKSAILLNATTEYQSIWAQFGSKIVDEIEDATHIKFKTKDIIAIVYEGKSQSHPFKLRASFDDKTKKATLVHELVHIISSDHMIPFPDSSKEDASLELHKQINLVLFDIWSKLFSRDFAEENVGIESARSQTYKEAWEWALQFNPEVRKQRFTELTNAII